MISFLLGAGFSIPLGYPSAEDVNREVLSAKECGYGVHPSGVLLKNCPDLYDPYWETLIAIIKDYESSHSFDYEKFYDYLSKWKLTTRACREINMLKNAGYPLMIPDQLLNLYQQLVFTIVNPNPDKGGDYSQYKGFINFINRKYVAEPVNIHTLNHDLLIEDFSQNNMFQVALSDGFTENSPYVYEPQSGGNRVCPFYNGVYASNFRLYKLHGSFSYFENKVLVNGSPTNGEYANEDVMLKNCGRGGDLYKVNGENIIGCYTQPAPYFLTGKYTKVRQYGNNSFSKRMFEAFKKNLDESSVLYVIGYGFKDDGINTYLTEYAKHGRTIVIDPSPNKAAITDVCGDSYRAIDLSITEVNFEDIKMV